MPLGDRKTVRMLGRFTVGQLLGDENPYTDEVWKVIQLGQVIHWTQDRIHDEDEFHRLVGDVTTDVTLELVARSPEGEEKVRQFWERFRNPIKDAGGKLKITASRAGFFEHHRTRAFRLTRRPLPLEEKLEVLGEEPVAGYDGYQTDMIYAMPEDGWYESRPMMSPSVMGVFFFEVKDGKLGEVVDQDTLCERYGLHWSQKYEAELRFREEMAGTE